MQRFINLLNISKDPIDPATKQGQDSANESLSHLVDSGIKFDNDNTGSDAFGRQRVSSPYTVYDIKQNTSAQPLFYDDQEVSGSGTSSVYNNDKASVTMSVAGGTAGKRVRQTKVWSQYQPGKSQMLIFSGNFRGAVPGVTKRSGMFFDSWGLFYQVDGTGISAVIRTNNTGSPVDTAVHQNNWNVDKLDGTGSSGINLDLEKAQLGVIDYEWLGVGQVRFCFKFDGRIVEVHRFTHSNSNEEVYMSNPNAPFRYEIENDGSGAAATFDHICVSVQSEGGQEENQIITYVSRDGSPITLANQDLYTPVLSIRLKADRPCTRITVKDLSIIITSAINFEWILFLNPAIAGTDQAIWLDVENSALQFDISRNATNFLSGGYKIEGGYGASSNQIKNPTGDAVTSFLTIGSMIDGSMDEFVLAVKNIEGNGGVCYAGLTVSEYC